MNQFHNTDNCYTGGTDSVFNGGAGFAINGGAVSLDSQGCKPLVGVLPNTIAPRFNFVTRLRTEVADAIDT